jgi:ParB family chromosome partitioning protein
VKIEDITVGPRKREAGDVSALAESIDVLGLLNPVTVVIQQDHDGHSVSHDEPVLVAGARRMEACKQLGWTEIDATVVELYDIDLKLAEIDENLIREPLTALQRAEQLAQRKGIFEMKGGTKSSTLGESGKIFPTLGGRGNTGFAKDASNKVGATKRTINEDVKIGEGIPAALRDELRGTESEDSREDLRALAREKDNPAAQKKAVEAVKSGEATNLRTALKTKPKPPTKTATRMAVDELAECLRDHPNQDELRACLAFFKKTSPWVGKVLWRLDK